MCDFVEYKVTSVLFLGDAKSYRPTSRYLLISTSDENRCVWIASVMADVIFYRLQWLSLYTSRPGLHYVIKSGIFYQLFNVELTQEYFKRRIRCIALRHEVDAKFWFNLAVGFIRSGITGSEDCFKKTELLQDLPTRCKAWTYTRSGDRSWHKELYDCHKQVGTS